MFVVHEALLLGAELISFRQVTRQNKAQETTRQKAILYFRVAGRTVLLASVSRGAKI